jgi:15-cis-phytoene synthase
MSADYGYCQSLIRERDYDRFLADLFAPAEARPHLFALHAFESEIVHVADAVREPMAGEIRYQWWRDVVHGERGGEAASNPVAAALLEAIAVHGLPRDLLLGFIDKRSLDLAGAPPDDCETMLAYVDATAVASVGLSVRVLVGEVPALTPAVLAAGRAIGISKMLTNFTRDAARGRLFVPLDLLAKYDVHTRSVFAGESSVGLAAALRELKTRALAEIESLRGLAIPVAVLPAFLPVAVLPKYLAHMDRSNFDPFRTPLETSRLHRQFTIWRAARRGVL